MNIIFFLFLSMIFFLAIQQIVPMISLIFFPFFLSRACIEKDLTERLDSFEKAFSDVFSSLEEYVHKNASLRDKADKLAKSIVSLADSDKICSTTKDALIGVGYTLSGVEDYRHSSIERLQSKILQPMTVYGDLIRTVRESVKKMLSSSKESAKDTGKEVLTAIPSQAEKHAIQVDAFESKKLTDIKTIMKDFLTIQMIFHCKAVETLTKGLQSIGNINESDDLNQFRHVFKMHAFISESSLPGYLPSDQGILKSLENKEEVLETQSDEEEEQGQNEEAVL